MSQDWFVKTSTGKAGPFSASQLRKLATNGKISSKNFVSPDGSKWVQATRIKGLEFPAPAAEAPTQQQEPVVEEEETQFKEIVLLETKGAGRRRKNQNSSPVGGVAGVMGGAVTGMTCFALLWLFWVINIWPFAFGLGGLSGGDPSNSAVGRLASSISASALSIFAVYGLLAFLVLGTLAGVAGVSGAPKVPNDQTSTKGKRTGTQANGDTAPHRG